MKEVKELVPRDEYGIFADTGNNIRVDSLYVAWVFEKTHAHVMRDIDKLSESKSGLTEEFVKENFDLSSYQDKQGKARPYYIMTRDGFMILVMGYSGVRAMQLKEQYIRRFNEMEELLKGLATAKQEFPSLTRAIRLMNDNPRSYDFSTECDMINQVALGMTAAEFRAKNGIEKGKSIRPYLSKKQAAMVEELQRADIGFIINTPDRELRKRWLTLYKGKITGKI